MLLPELFRGSLHCVPSSSMLARLARTRSAALSGSVVCRGGATLVGNAATRGGASCAIRGAACRTPARRGLCADATATISESVGGRTTKQSLLVEGQVDSGMWQGAALLAGVYGSVTLSSEEQRATAVASLLGWYRMFGLKAEFISDRRLIEDYVRKNAVAACASA